MRVLLGMGFYNVSCKIPFYIGEVAKMPVTLDGKLVIAISSQALFDLDDSNKIFEEKAKMSI